MEYDFSLLKEIFTYDIARDNLKYDIENALNNQYIADVSVKFENMTDHLATMAILVKVTERDCSQKDIENIVRSYARAKRICIPDYFDDVSNELIAEALDDYITYDYDYLRRKMPEFVKDFVKNSLFGTGVSASFDIINKCEKDKFAVDVVFSI